MQSSWRYRSKPNTTHVLIPVLQLCEDAFPELELPAETDLLQFCGALQELLRSAEPFEQLLTLIVRADLLSQQLTWSLLLMIMTEHLRGAKACLFT